MEFAEGGERQENVIHLAGLRGVVPMRHQWRTGDVEDVVNKASTEQGAYKLRGR